jgi:hypothetical protein
VVIGKLTHWSLVYILPALLHGGTAAVLGGAAYVVTQSVVRGLSIPQLSFAWSNVTFSAMFSGSDCFCSDQYAKPNSTPITKAS